MIKKTEIDFLIEQIEILPSFDACNPSEDTNDNSFEPEEAVAQKETPKKKKRFFGLF